MRVRAPCALAEIALNVALAAVELGRLALAPASASLAWLALLATACALPLHVRHVVYGRRRTRPPHGSRLAARAAALSRTASGICSPDGRFRLSVEVPEVAV